MGKSQSKQPISEAKDANYARFAFVGFSGCGKSAFVNAVRGIDDEDEQAARVDIVETRVGPIEYTYPSHPFVSFCDLPGYGTPRYPASDLETYWRKLELEKFDIFLIFISPTVTKPDLEIIQKVKSFNKSFFLIRTKIDEAVECMMRKHKKCPFKEEDLLSKIKDYLIKETEHLSCIEEDIFLISNYDPYKWDFFRLIQAIMNMFPASQIGTTRDLTEQYLAEVRTHIEEKGVCGIEEFLRKKLEGYKEVKIRFCITGDGGTGKSAFINAVRGFKDDDDGAAEVGVTQTTTEPTEYKLPDNPMISFVDLPGIGTPTYPDLPTYCENVGFEGYDIFLIFTATRFTQHDLELAKKVKSLGKSFFLIRAKIDDDCMPKNGRSINEPEILKRIRQNCMDNVKDFISSEKEIFLISNYDKDKYDFDCLIAAISDALPVLQRECLTLSLSNVTRECLKRKAKFFKAQAVAVAAISAGTGAIPIPGVGGIIDAVLIGSTITVYYRQFGLNDTTSEELPLLDKKCREIIKRYQLSSAKELALNVATKMFGFKFGVEEVSKFIPIIGMAIAGVISFGLTLRYLIRSINELEEVSIAVWDNAAKKDSKTGTNNSPTQ